MQKALNYQKSGFARGSVFTRSGYLRGQWNRLNQMAWQYGAYLQGRIGITQAERQHAQQLIDMMREVEEEGVKVENDLRNDVLKELANVLMHM